MLIQSVVTTTVKTVSQFSIKRRLSCMDKNADFRSLKHSVNVTTSGCHGKRPVITCRRVNKHLHAGSFHKQKNSASRRTHYLVHVRNEKFHCCYKQTKSRSKVTTVTEKRHTNSGSKRHCQEQYIHRNMQTCRQTITYTALSENDEHSWVTVVGFPVVTFNTSMNACKRTKTSSGVTTMN